MQHTICKVKKKPVDESVNFTNAIHLRHFIMQRRITLYIYITK